MQKEISIHAKKKQPSYCKKLWSLKDPIMTNPKAITSMPTLIKSGLDL